MLAAFVYAADGQRVQGTVGGVTTVYLAGVYEYELDTGATTQYYEGNALRRTGYATDNGIYYLLQDHLHSSSATVAQNGTLVGARNYFYPFGGNRGGAGFNTLTAKRFTGQYHEASLPGGEGLSYYGARWYDAQLGRFVTPDTIVPKPDNPQDLNRYGYVRNNPLKYEDPSGHCAVYANGKPNTTADRRCWQLAYRIYGLAGSPHTSFARDWRIPADRWLATIASAFYADEAYLQPLVDKYYNEWAGAVGLTKVKWHEEPPPPQWVKEARLTHYTSLYQCAKAVQGACGIGVGGTVVTPGVAGRGSFDFYVDKNGDYAGFGTIGFGPSLTLFPGILAGPSYTASVVPKASVRDISGWSVQLGGSGAFGRGVGADLSVAISEHAPRGISVGTPAGTWNAEVHATLSYTAQIFPRKRGQ